MIFFTALLANTHPELHCSWLVLIVPLRILMSIQYFYFFIFLRVFFKDLFIIITFLAASGLSCHTQDLHWGTQDLHWGMQDLSLWLSGSWLWYASFSLVVACGFSLSSCGPQAPGYMGSVVCGTQALVEAHELIVVACACGLSCPVACGILVPWPGIEPTSPALDGRFFTTGPPGKSQDSILKLH